MGYMTDWKRGLDPCGTRVPPTQCDAGSYSAPGNASNWLGSKNEDYDESSEDEDEDFKKLNVTIHHAFTDSKKKNSKIF